MKTKFTIARFVIKLTCTNQQADHMLFLWTSDDYIWKFRQWDIFMKHNSRLGKNRLKTLIELWVALKP